ncbi:MAG: hypothetical protein IKC48_01375 [Clostridia bacterium]|nr:hypothetical protein [Clostridia bacterium]
MNIIDIGSNSVRLFCGGKKTVITTRLAENMRGGLLAPESINRTVDAISSLNEQGGGSCLAFATAAVRNASNKGEFLDLVFARTGIKVDVISGEKEAEIGFLGATEGIGRAAVIDLGGASCEIIFGESGKISYKQSFPFGCVSLTDRFGSDYEQITKFVSDTLCAVPYLRVNKYIAIGGTATSLAAMNLGLCEYDSIKVHGSTLTLPQISSLIDGVIAQKDYPTLSPMRRKTIGQGATALIATIKALGQSEVEVSEKDNLEGYLLSLNKY